MVSSVFSGSSCRILIVATTLIFFICNVACAEHEFLFQSGPPDNHGHESHWSWRPTGSPPDNMTITDGKYFIHSHFGTLQETMTSAMVASIQNASDLWSMANSGALVNFVGVSTAAEQDIHIHLANLDGNVGGVLGQIFPSFLGHESVNYADGDPWHRIAFVTLVMDSNEPWFAGANFDQVIRHELGHSLGLGHADPNSEPSSVMILGVAQQGLTLTDEDRDAIQHLYGVPEPGTWIVLLFGMLAMLFRRVVVVS